MGEVKKNIRDLSKEYGSKTKAKSAAEDWFNDSVKAIRENSVQRTGQRFAPGKVYVFRYDDPKWADWWDRNPVVLALDPAGSNDCGINLNMLPVAVKEELLDEVYTRYQGFIKGQAKKQARSQAQLSFGYEGAKNFLKRFGYDFAIRQYIPNRKAQQAVVSYNDWHRIALCDFLELEGKSIGAVRALFRNHLNK